MPIESRLVVNQIFYILFSSRFVGGRSVVELAVAPGVDQRSRQSDSAIYTRDTTN